jgi:hypothetical protein
VKRVTDDLPGALADLEQAEAVAVQYALLAAQARIHFLRGNLCFPRGDIEGCLREHGIALELARRAGAVELSLAMRSTFFRRCSAGSVVDGCNAINRGSQRGRGGRRVSGKRDRTASTGVAPTPRAIG